MVKLEINRIKVVLTEIKKKNKWLAEQLNKDEPTISQRCTNARQPSLDTLLSVEDVLNVDIRVLLNSTKDQI